MRNFLDKNYQLILNFASGNIGADFYPPPIKMLQKQPFSKQNESCNRVKKHRYAGLSKQQEGKEKRIIPSTISRMK